MWGILILADLWSISIHAVVVLSLGKNFFLNIIQDAVTNKSACSFVFVFSPVCTTFTLKKIHYMYNDMNMACFAKLERWT